MKASPPKVYFASKLRHAPMWRDLRAGRLSFCKIVSSWIDHPNAQAEADGHLSAPADYAHIWTVDVQEAASADFVLLYATDDDIHRLSGSKVECGVALGRGKRVIAIGHYPESWSWLWHPRVYYPRSSFLDPAIEHLEYFAASTKEARRK